MSTSPTQIATAGQHGYIEDLVKRAGLESTADAIALVFPETPAVLGRTEASRLIAALEKRVGSPTRDTSSPSTHTSAKQIRKLAMGTTPLDKIQSPDARWIVDRLRKFAAIENVLAAGKNQNVGGPIAMDLLVSYFQGWDRLAEAFDVTVPTAKAWGSHLPASRAYEAQIKTGGFVHAPIGH